MGTRETPRRVPARLFSFCIDSMNNCAVQKTAEHRPYAMVSARVRSTGSCRSRALAHVPFDFVVGDRVREAGPYSIEASEVMGMLVMRRAGCDSQPVLVQAIRHGRRRAVHKLLFYCQQNLYFLAQIVVGIN